MARKSHTVRVVRVFRYDPSLGDQGHFDRFELEIENESLTTILDLLLRIQQEHDLTLSFRFACRVSMCGSCAMVINGRERLACKTIVADLKKNVITVRPLNHFPIVKDLVVDMGPFFEKYKEAMPFFEASRETDEPAVIRPDCKEREDIGLSTECIACGACVSSCSMIAYHKDYLGPAALNRAFTLLADSRDGLHESRMVQVLAGCYNCRTEFNCTEVCPKEISPTRAIKYIQKRAAKAALHHKPHVLAAREALQVTEDHPETGKATELKVHSPKNVEDLSRRRFLKNVTYGLGAATALVVGGVLTSTAIAPSLRETPKNWIRVGKMEEFVPGKVRTVNIRYDVQDGFYTNEIVDPVMVTRTSDENNIVIYNSRCTHLGCTVHWDERKQLFLCACHGGAFDLAGRVKAGPPPRPLDRYAFKVQAGYLFVEV